MLIAIDGPAASGKSTVAKALAGRLGIGYLDTGAMYRALAYDALENGVDLDDEKGLTVMAESASVEFEILPGSPLPTKVLLNGRDVSAQIRTPRVDAAVSLVARVPGVRSAMVREQRRIAAAGDYVVEGRDIGTVVFPDADVKVFLNASSEERARRRHEEHSGVGHDVDQAEVRRRLMDRDAKDMKRAISPLEPAPDALLVDTTGMTIEEVIEAISAKAGLA